MCGCGAAPPLRPACFSFCGFMLTLYTYSSHISCIWPGFLASQIFLGPGFTMCCAVLSHLDTSDSLRPHGTVSLGILQVRIWEWGAMPSSRGSSQSRYQTQVSRIAGRLFTIWATMGAPKTSLILLEFESFTILTNVTFMILPKSLIKISTRLGPRSRVCLFQWWPTLWNPFTLTIIRISLRDN